MKELSEVTDLVQLAKENRITRKTREPFDLSGRSGPDLVFGASTGLIGGNGIPRQEKRSLCEFAALGKIIRDGFHVFLHKAHRADNHRAVRIHKNECGNVGQAVGIRDDIALAFFVEQYGKRDAVLSIEVRSFLRAIL